jgi:hypothetical protein
MDERHQLGVGSCSLQAVLGCKARCSSMCHPGLQLLLLREVRARVRLKTELLEADVAAEEAHAVTAGRVAGERPTRPLLSKVICNAAAQLRQRHIPQVSRQHRRPLRRLLLLLSLLCSRAVPLQVVVASTHKARPASPERCESIPLLLLLLLLSTATERAWWPLLLLCKAEGGGWLAASPAHRGYVVKAAIRAEKRGDECFEGECRL